MKLVLIALLSLLIGCSISFDTNCEDYKNAIEDVESLSDNLEGIISEAYDSAKKASNSLDTIDVKKYAKKCFDLAKGIETILDDIDSSTSDASFIAFDCDCEDGEDVTDILEDHINDMRDYTEQLLKLSLESYVTNNFEDAIKHAKQATKEADVLNDLISDVESIASNGIDICD